MSIFTREFWIETIERAIKTGAQAVVLGLGLGEGFNAFEVDWLLGLGFGLGGMVLSVLTSIASSRVTGRASLTRSLTH